VKMKEVKTGYINAIQRARQIAASSYACPIEHVHNDLAPGLKVFGRSFLVVR